MSDPTPLDQMRDLNRRANAGEISASQHAVARLNLKLRTLRRPATLQDHWNRETAEALADTRIYPTPGELRDVARQMIIRAAVRGADREAWRLLEASLVRLRDAYIDIARATTERAA